MAHLQDTSKYVIKTNVPVLDEHQLFDDQGKVLARIDESRLRQIASNNNRRIKETGDEVPLIIGHTKDEAKEGEQPEIVGYACDFKVKRLFRTGRKAIFATFKFFKDKAHLAAKYPRRSVELWLRKWEIDPISLLGASTPERSLGLLRFSRQDGLSYKHLYSAGSNPPMDPKQIVQQVMAAIEQTDVWQFMTQLMKQEEAQQGDPAEAGPTAQEPDEVPMDSPEGQGDMPPEQPEEEPEAYEAEDDMTQYDAAPSGSNTFSPSYGGNKGLAPKPKVMQKPKLFGPKKMSRTKVDQVRTQVARKESQLVRMQRQLEDMQIKYQRAERERDLIQLESEGYLFDREEELTRLAPIPEDQYQAQLGIIRKRYQRDISGHSFTAVEHSRMPRRAKGGTTKEQAMEKAQKALKAGKDYEDIDEDGLV